MSVNEHLMKKTNATILVIDDQEDILFTAKMLLKKHYETIYTLNNPKNVVQLLAENEIDLVLLDMNYRIGFEDGREGLYFLKEIKKLSPNTIVILMTAFGKVETAVEGLKSGAFDYVLKPWDNDKLLETIKKGVSESRKNKKSTSSTQSTSSYFTGTSKSIEKAYSLANKVAKTDANVLVLGENGTGKYVLARYIHDNSERKNNEFIHFLYISLGSLSELETQLIIANNLKYTSDSNFESMMNKSGRSENKAGTIRGVSYNQTFKQQTRTNY